MITVTLRALVEAQPALRALAEQSLPVKQAYHLARLIRALEPELAAFETQRRALFARHGRERAATDAERPAHGETVIEIAPAAIAAFRVELAELLETTIEVDRPRIALNGALQITGVHVLALEPFVTVGEAP